MIILTLFIICTYAVYYRFFRVLGYWKSKNVVSPKADYIFGHFKRFALQQKSFGSITKELYESYPNEKVIGIYQMTTPCLMVRDLDIIKRVLIKDFDNFVDRGIELDKNGLGLNLFHSDGDTWRFLRHRFTPLFTSGKLKNMTYLLVHRGEKILEYIKPRVQKQKEQEVYFIMQKYTISSISACAFGLDLEMDSKEYEQLDAIDRLIFTYNLGTVLQMLFPSLFKLFNCDMFPRGVFDFFFNLVKDITSERSRRQVSRHDFMDLLLELRKMGNIKGTKTSENITSQDTSLEITDTVIAAQAFVFFAAGYETTATTLSYVFYELAMHPEIQEKVIDEIDRVLKENNDELSYDVLKEMKYLGRVFDETLRLHPVVEPLSRKSLNKYKIPGMDVTIEKGQLIYMSAFGIHYDEKYYPNPMKFDPERFTPENVKKRHPCAYLPFGAGPRYCIGTISSSFISLISHYIQIVINIIYTIYIYIG